MTSRTPTWRTRPRWCSSGSSRRRSPRSSSCGCARPPATTVCRCTAVAPFATRGLTRCGTRSSRRARREAGGARRRWPKGAAPPPGAILLVGERLATSPGALSRRGDWPPRPAPGSAGCRGAPAIAARWRPAACRTCCPAAAPSPTRRARRADRGLARRRPAGTAGRDTAGILAAAPDGELGALLIGGVELADLPDPRRRTGRDRGGAVRRQPGIAAKARSPTSPTWCSRSRPWSRRPGTFVNWEGRLRPFERRWPATRHPICGCCTRSPTRSASTSACRTPRPPAENSPSSAGGAARGPPRPRSRGRAAAARRGRGGAGRAGGCC